MAVLPGVLECSFGFAQDRLPLRRTVQVRLGTIPRYRGTVARWHAHLHGLATGIHEISRLGSSSKAGARLLSQDLLVDLWRMPSPTGDIHKLALSL
jgi:hypothetical protein